MAYHWPGWCRGYNTQAALCEPRPLDRPQGLDPRELLGLGAREVPHRLQQGPAVTRLREAGPGAAPPRPACAPTRFPPTKEMPGAEDPRESPVARSPSALGVTDRLH